MGDSIHAERPLFATGPFPLLFSSGVFPPLHYQLSLPEMFQKKSEILLFTDLQRLTI